MAIDNKVPARVVAELVSMVDTMMGDYSNGYLYRAEELRGRFFDELKEEHTWAPSGKFGQLWHAHDYAFRVLMNPAYREQLAARFNEANAYRIANPSDDAKPFKDMPAVIALANKVLDAAAAEQAFDLVMVDDYDECEFFEEFFNEICTLNDTGATERS